MRESLRGIIRQHKPDRVGIESPVFKELYSEGMYGLFLYSCEALKGEKMDTIFFSPKQVKAHARLHLQRPDWWEMKKPDMVEAAKGHDLADHPTAFNHNEADAYWVSVASGRFWEFWDGVLPIDELTPVERDQFLRVHTYQRGKHAGEVRKSGMLYREDDRFFLWSQA